MVGPHFFLDRSLGRRQVPQLLRDDGWTLVTLSEHYGVPADEAVADVDWLQLAGQNQWPALMKDEKIRHRPTERAAVIAHDVCAFYLTSGNLSGQRMAELLIAIGIGSGVLHPDRERLSSPCPAPAYVRSTSMVETASVALGHQTNGWDLGQHWGNRRTRNSPDRPLPVNEPHLP